MTPWELERLLDCLGWRVLYGWGSFSMPASGITNVLASEELPALPIPLQQAACTFWVTIATPRSDDASSSG